MAIEIIFRFMLQMTICVISIAIFIFGGRDENLLILMIVPFIAVPTLFFHVIILIPLDIYLRRIGKGWHGYYLVPLVAALLPWMMFVFGGHRSDFISASNGLSFFALCWGLLWMGTRIAYRSSVMLKRSMFKESKDVL